MEGTKNIKLIILTHILRNFMVLQPCQINPLALEMDI